MIEFLLGCGTMLVLLYTMVTGWNWRSEAIIERGGEYTYRGRRYRLTATEVTHEEQSTCP